MLPKKVGINALDKVNFRFICLMVADALVKFNPS